MYEFTVFTKSNITDPFEIVIPRWQLRHDGILVAAAPLGRVYAFNHNGIIVKAAVSKSLWTTLRPGHKISPALQPKDVLQPGKDTVHATYQMDDLGIGEVAQGWAKTAFCLRHEKQL